jgi:hypothetical protein
MVTPRQSTRLFWQELKRIQMTSRSLLFICVLAVSSVGIASAKSYYITLTAPTKAGATQLKAGEYEVSLKGNAAVFTKDGGKPVSVPVKIEQSDKKFDSTSVDTANDTIREIDLGGSSTKLTFPQ